MNTFPKILSCADLLIDVQAGSIHGKQEQARLGPVNMKVLCVLLASQGDLVTRGRLFSEVWPNQEISDEALTRAVSDIRSVFKKLSSHDRYIETVPKKGYRWLPPLDVVNPNSEASSRGDGASTLNEDSTFNDGTLTDGTFTDGTLNDGTLNDGILNDGILNENTLNKATKAKWHWADLQWLPLLAVLMLGVLSFSVWGVSALLTRPSASLAILAPVSQSGPLAEGYHEALLARFINDSEINVLSDSAIKDISGNVYPLLYHRFGTRWIVESQMRSLAADVTVITSLVDARSGFVVYRQVNTYPQTPNWVVQEAEGFYTGIAPWLVP